MTTLVLPAEITVAVQPYGWFTLTDLQQVEGVSKYSGPYSYVEGKVKAGSWTGALWCGVAVVPAKDITGHTETVWGLTQEQIDLHLKTGEPIIRIAM